MNRSHHHIRRQILLLRPGWHEKQRRQSEEVMHLTADFLLKMSMVGNIRRYVILTKQRRENNVETTMVRLVLYDRDVNRIINLTCMHS